MTVAELIAALQELPADAVAYYWDDDCGIWVPAEECYAVPLDQLSPHHEHYPIANGVGIR